MAKKLESSFQDRVISDLKALPKTHVFKIQQLAKRGDPDLLVCIAGKFVALELKKDEKTGAEPLQLYELDQVDRAGGFTAVVHPLNWPGVLAALTKLAHFQPAA